MKQEISIEPVQLVMTKSELEEVVMQAVKKALQELSTTRQRKEEEDTYLTAAEVCNFIGCAKSTLQRWEKCGYLVPTRVGGKVRYSEKEVMSLYKKGESNGK